MVLSIIIPAYNESSSIGRILKRLSQLNLYMIIVVDDGSKKSLESICYKYNVTYIKHMINRGQGAAIQTGLEYLKDISFDVIVFMDADGQHQLKDISNLINPILIDKYDCALGSRFLDKKNKVPLYKVMILKIGKLLSFLLYQLELTDTHCGFIAFSKGASKKIYISEDRYAYYGQLLYLIHKYKLLYLEVGVHVLYTKYSKYKGQSSLNSFSVGFKMIFNKFVKI